jgi:hypothetical protein
MCFKGTDTGSPWNQGNGQHQLISDRSVVKAVAGSARCKVQERMGGTDRWVGKGGRGMGGGGQCAQDRMQPQVCDYPKMRKKGQSIIKP